VVPIFQGTGAWLFAPLSSFSPSPDIIAGTYNGLQLIHFNNGTFSNAGKIEGLQESLRFLVTDNYNNLWSSHPYRGVYKMQLTADKRNLRSRLYTQKEGLPSSLNNSVYELKNRMVVATESGVYEYDESTDRFI